MDINKSRREFIKLNSRAGLGAALSLGALSTYGNNTELGTELNSSSADLKVCHRLKTNATDSDLLFLKQIGVEWVRLEFNANEGSKEHIQALQKKLGQFDIKIYSATHTSYATKEIHLGLEGRDKDIDRYCTFLKDIGELGINTAAYSFHSATTYSTGFIQRRGYTAREFDLDIFRNKLEKQRYDREYSAEDIWNSYTYFIKAVLPAAEKAGVNLALHPDDPPLAMMNGVAKIFSHADGFKRAEKIAQGSKNWGLCFCAGTWAEGGVEMGMDVFEMIREYGRKGKIFEVHFRNVSSPLPRFQETFPDDGYLDMHQLMKELRNAKVHAAVMADHIPKLEGDQGILRSGTAYCISNMKTILTSINK